MRLSLKLTLLSACLTVVFLGGAGYLAFARLLARTEQEFIARDRQLAKVLAGLRNAEGKLDFDTLHSFVESSDKAETGLVYAIETDTRGTLRQGTLNPRLFVSLGRELEVTMQQGRKTVLELLLAGKVDRQGRIKEYVLPLPEGQLRLGFDVQRHDRRLREEERGALGICLAGLLLTLGGMALLARRLLAPLRRLTEAAEAAAKGPKGKSPLPVYASGEFAGLTRSFEKLTGALRHLERVRDLFALYLGPEVLRRVLKEENPAELGAEERAVTVAVFSLAGFGAVSRRSGPRETLRLLNEHLPHVLDAILDGRGMVDRLEGEVLVAIWGAPDDVQEPEYKATCAALAARTALEGEAKRQAAAGGQTLQLTVGICTGRAAVGHIGSAKRISYRVLGGPVELAGQVQRMARPGEILLAETTYTKISNRVEVVSAAPLMLPEMDEALPLYRLKRLVG